MSNIIDSIDSINKELEYRANEYKSSSTDTNGGDAEDVVMNSNDLITNEFLDPYPKPKPTERVVGYIEIK